MKIFLSPFTPEFGRVFVAMVAVQLVVTGCVTQCLPLGIRPFAMFASTVVPMLGIAAAAGIPRKPKLAAIVLSSVTSVACISGWRRFFDPLGFLGPVPGSLAVPVLGVSAGLTIVFASLVAVVATPGGGVYRWRWGFVVLLSVVVVGTLCGLSTGSRIHSLAARMQQLLTFEGRLDSAGRFERQDLGFWLGVFGRGSEAQAFSTRATRTDDPRIAPAEIPTEIARDVAAKSVAWRKAIAAVAARERIVVIMEAHNVTQHREWIAQTLPIFHEAGFRHYAAEGLAEAGEALKQRGFPILSTGAYVADPRFGNLLRRAIELDFTIHDYEAHLATEFAEREEQQAQTLANFIAANPGCKLVVHAGYAHTFKTEVPGVGRCMAARLWEKAGIEPYCIYQANADYDSPNYPRWAELAKAADEPQMLIPPPPGLTDPQFADIPARAIDALVMHPVSKGRAPDQRKPVFAKGLTQVSGRWLETDWPIVVGAYAVGEPVDAIALDQVLLRQGESEFELWIPARPYELRVTALAGVVKIDIESTGYQVLLRMTNR